ncbi:GTPase RsgA [Paenibacillus sp. S150]|uniref:GTPase RsgA n=1 Tax=Paenibacillus sp. S150 TaxID=2749826 RepID=UPI002816191D|nr:GTPase RsgA [Paenibacillus sp. S150]
MTELRRERFTVMTERGEVTAVLKGTFYHSAETRVGFPCAGDFVLLHCNERGDSLIVTVLPRRSKFSRANYSGHAAGYAKTMLEQAVARRSEGSGNPRVDSRGRHTTTHRQLFMLPSGAMVIDTPGMRELGLFDADEGIRAGFTDMEEWFAQCRFTDCRHQAEPGCAVLAALADSSLPRERW